MPLTHQLILALIVTGFVLYLFALIWVWFWTRGRASDAATETKRDESETRRLDLAA